MPRQKHSFRFSETYKDLWEPIVADHLVLYDGDFVERPEKLIDYELFVERGKGFLRVAYDPEKIDIATYDQIGSSLLNWNLLGPWNAPARLNLYWRRRSPGLQNPTKIP